MEWSLRKQNTCSAQELQGRTYLRRHLYEGGGEGLMPLEACKGLADRETKKHKWREKKNYVEKWIFLGNI